jgi:hypothetical protein
VREKVIKAGIEVQLLTMPGAGVRIYVSSIIYMCVLAGGAVIDIVA